MMPFDLAQRDAFLRRMKSLGDSPLGPAQGSVESRLQAADSIVTILIEPLEVFIGERAVNEAGTALLQTSIRILTAFQRAVQILRAIDPMSFDAACNLTEELRGFWDEFTAATEGLRTAPLQAAAEAGKPFTARQGRRPTLGKNDWLIEQSDLFPELGATKLAKQIFDNGTECKNDLGAHFCWSDKPKTMTKAASRDFIDRSSREVLTEKILAGRITHAITRRKHPKK